MSDEAAAYATAIENLQREDMDLEDTARWLAYLQQLTGLSQRELAKRLGKTHNWVSRRLRLLERPDLLARIRAGALTQEAALGLIVRSDPADGEVYQPDTDTERAALDDGEVYQADTPRRATPTTFRWRPLQQVTIWLDRTPPAAVPPAERATLRAQIALIEEKLAVWKRALDEGED